MSSVIHALTHWLVLMWAAILYCALKDVAFSAALLVAVLGYALIDLLLRRIGPHLWRIIGSLLFVLFLIALATDPPFRESVQRFVQDVLPAGPRCIVWGLVITFAYGVLHRERQPAA